MPSRYDEKRDFTKTPEPAMSGTGPDSGPLTFVIQKHDATRLHYDFRIEMDGVLKSWAVPKGPSLDPQEKRLAVMVEDHPLDYGAFEGVIPEGNYGAGEVIVWDRGIYAPDEEGEVLLYDRERALDQLRRGIEKGKISVFLHGSKLKGSWALVRLKGDKNEWLFFKHSDEFADPQRDVLLDDRSVISGLSIEDLKDGKLPAGGAPGILPHEIAGAKAGPLPSKPMPMAAHLADGPFDDEDWIFEAKLDGIRCLAALREGETKLTSRRGLDMTKQYPALVEELKKQHTRNALFDGEIVAFDSSGKPSFHTLQQRMNRTREADIRAADANIPVFFFIFDIIHADGYDLTGVPLSERKVILKRLLLPTDRVAMLDHFGGKGIAAYNAAVKHGYEGAMAKHRDSKYECGRRSSRWLKIKTTLSDEFIVGGFSEGLGGRRHSLGAILVGRYDDDGNLVYSGHVGSGFNESSLDEVKAKLEAMKTDKCPFSEIPPQKTPTSWVEPKLVAEVKFAELTPAGHLRAPVFLRLREDVPAAEVLFSEPVKMAETVQIDPDEIAEQLAGIKKDGEISVGAYRVGVTNLSKVLWPEHATHEGLTKRDLLIYLARVGEYMLPHLEDRPLTLSRFPEGIQGEQFYQKHWEHSLPPFVHTVELYSESNNEDQEYMICNNLPTLLWMGQLANLEFHPWTSRVSTEGSLGAVSTGSSENIDASALNYPDYLLFDLDPYIYSGLEAQGAEPELNRKAFEKTCEAALWVRDLLANLSLDCYIKTSGRTGLHLYVPIERTLTYDAVRAAAATVCQFILNEHREDITTEWAVVKRSGKIFMDYNQNTRGKTLASIYSPRALPEGAVSTPIEWDEVGKVYPTDFTLKTLPERLKVKGDLWAGIRSKKKDLRKILG